jgi:hypothetical protein
MIRAYPEEIVNQYSKPQNSSVSNQPVKVYLVYYPEDQTYKLMVLGFIIVIIVAIVGIVEMVKK